MGLHRIGLLLVVACASAGEQNGDLLLFSSGDESPEGASEESADEPENEEAAAEEPERGPRILSHMNQEGAPGPVAPSPPATDGSPIRLALDMQPVRGEIPEWAVSRHAPEVLVPWNRTGLRIAPDSSPALWDDERDAIAALRAQANAIAACIETNEADGVRRLGQRSSQSERDCLAPIASQTATGFFVLARWEQRSLRELIAVEPTHTFEGRRRQVRARAVQARANPSSHVLNPWAD